MLMLLQHGDVLQQGGGWLPQLLAEVPDSNPFKKERTLGSAKACSAVVEGAKVLAGAPADYQEQAPSGEGLEPLEEDFFGDSTDVSDVVGCWKVGFQHQEGIWVNLTGEN